MRDLKFFTILKYKIRIVKNLENLKLKTSDIEWSKVGIARGRKPTPVAYRGLIEQRAITQKHLRQVQYETKKKFKSKIKFISNLGWL